MERAPAPKLCRNPARHSRCDTQPPAFHQVQPVTVGNSLPATPAQFTLAHVASIHRAPSRSRSLLLLARRLRRQGWRSKMELKDSPHFAPSNVAVRHSRRRAAQDAVRSKAGMEAILHRRDDGGSRSKDKPRHNCSRSCSRAMREWVAGAKGIGETASPG